MAEPVLEARGVTKHYGHVLALDRASFSALPGEVVALIAYLQTLGKSEKLTPKPDANPDNDD